MGAVIPSIRATWLVQGAIIVANERGQKIDECTIVYTLPGLASLAQMHIDERRAKASAEAAAAAADL